MATAKKSTVKTVKTQGDKPVQPPAQDHTQALTAMLKKVASAARNTPDTK